MVRLIKQNLLIAVCLLVLEMKNMQKIFKHCRLLQRGALWHKFTNVSKKYTASIFKVGLTFVTKNFKAHTKISDSFQTKCNTWERIQKPGQLSHYSNQDMACSTMESLTYSRQNQELFFFLENVQSGYGPHPASCSIDTVSSFCGKKRPEREAVNATTPTEEQQLLYFLNAS